MTLSASYDTAFSCVFVFVSVLVFVRACVCVPRPGQCLSRQHVCWREPGHQDLQDVHPAVQGPRQIRQRRIQVGHTPMKKTFPSFQVCPRTVFQASLIGNSTSSAVVKVPSRLLQREPSQDGENLGREGDEEPHQVRTRNTAKPGVTWTVGPHSVCFCVCVCQAADGRNPKSRASPAP